MARFATCCLLAVVLALSLSASVAQDQNTCPELEQGIKQVRGADFSAAVLTLDDLARRLGQEGGSPKLLARTYVYLSIAYLGLSQVEQAKGAFLEALETDEALDLTPSEFPPKYLEFFQEARADAAAAQAAGAEEAEPATEEDAQVAPAAPASAPVTVDGSGSTKKGLPKALLVIGGVGAAAGVAVAVGGGGSEGASNAAPTPVPTPTPRDIHYSIQVALTPQAGSTTTASGGYVNLRTDLGFACNESASGITAAVHFYRSDGRACAEARWTGLSCGANVLTSVTLDRAQIIQDCVPPMELSDYLVILSNPEDSQFECEDPYSSGACSGDIDPPITVVPG
jgi:hypothetical protein